MLLEIAVGDSFGACFEWTDRWIITQYVNRLQYVTLEENPSLIKPGCYTDDTQMTLAIAEAMVEGIEWTPYNLAMKFVECFHRDPRRGYVTAAVDAIMRSNSLSELLVNCVNFAGDVDTISAIAMGPASFCKELKKDIPECLVSGLENGTYGRDYIVELDKTLLSKEF